MGFDIHCDLHQKPNINNTYFLNESHIIKHVKSIYLMQLHMINPILAVKIYFLILLAYLWLG